MSNTRHGWSDAEAELWALVKERRAPGADPAEVDRHIQARFEEPWAVMFTDLAGFSRRVAEFGITHFLQLILEQEELFDPLIEAHGGRVLKREGDSLLVLFAKPDEALTCSLEMQRAAHRANVGRKPEEEMLLCVGLGYGRVLRIGDADVWGAEVNAASKLGEDTAKAYEVLVTGGFRESVGHRSDVSFAPLDVSIPGAATAFKVGYAFDWVHEPPPPTVAK